MTRMRFRLTRRAAFALTAACIGLVLLVLGGCGGNSVIGPPQGQGTQEITLAQLLVMTNDGQPLVVADIRTPANYAQRHIAGSLNLPEADIDTWASTLDKQMRVCTVCT